MDAPTVTPLPTGPPPSLYVSGPLLKCIADQQLAGIVVDQPSPEQRSRVLVAALACGFAIPEGYEL